MRKPQLFQSQAASSSEPSSPSYSGLEGLKPGLSKEHVVQEAEAKARFLMREYSVIGVYPKILNDALETVQFSGEFRGAWLLLTAQITRRKDSENPMVWFVNNTISKDPSEVVDGLMFLPSGDGVFEITTLSVTKSNEEEDKLEKCMDGVKSRPGVLLHVANAEGLYHPNLMIFFPAQITLEAGVTAVLTHFPVRKGEAFVLHQNGTELTDKMRADILRTFEERIDSAVYAKDGGLYDLNTHQTFKAIPDSSQEEQAEVTQKGFCGFGCSIS